MGIPPHSPCDTQSPKLARHIGGGTARELTSGPLLARQVDKAFPDEGARQVGPKVGQAHFCKALLCRPATIRHWINAVNIWWIRT